MQSCNVTHVGLELLRSTGGTTQAVADFQAAFKNSDVVALCHRQPLLENGPFKSDWSYLPISNVPLLSNYSYVSKHSTEDIGSIAESSSLVIAHMLYRYNCNLTSNISRRYRIPYCVVPHGSLDPWVFSYRSWQKRLWLALYGRRFLENAASIVFATKRELLKAKQNVSVENGCVIHWPIDIPERSIVAAPRRTVREELGIPPADRILLYFGRVHSFKRPIETIKAFVNAATDNTHLVMVGPAQGISKEQCLAAAAPNLNRFHWVGPVYGDAKWKYIAAADGYITLSHRENFNYCLAECLGAGLPVIVSPGNDLAMELEPIDCGWILNDPTDTVATNAIRAFSTASLDSLRRLGENGRAFAVSELSREVFNKKLQTLVASLTQSTRNRPRS